MTRFSRNALAAAAALAAATAALPARADHDDGRWSPGRHETLPAPAYPGAPGVVPAPGPELYAPVRHAIPYRTARGEASAARELRAEYRRLDVARDRFYATWDGRPWARDRFEAWYASRRAELDHRWSELARWDHRW